MVDSNSKQQQKKLKYKLNDDTTKMENMSLYSPDPLPMLSRLMMRELLFAHSDIRFFEIIIASIGNVTQRNAQYAPRVFCFIVVVVVKFTFK